jgi:ATP-dependent RNA helicase DeaD
LKKSFSRRRGGGRPGGKSQTGPRSGSGGASSTSAAPLQPTAEPPDIQSFREWKLEAIVLDAIESLGIQTPTPIQRLAIGPVLEGRDVIAKAETGTGKTLAFGAPMISKVDPSRASVLGLVLTPTRELAEQVANVLRSIGEPRGLKIALVVGGEPMDGQVRALQAGAQVVVGTPGRVLDLYRQKFLTFPWTEFAVLDEADEMLEIGFLDDVEKILSFIPEERQTLLFSATFPPALLALARKHTRNPIEVATASGVKTVDNIQQSFISVEERDKPLALIWLIEQTEPKDVMLVFCDRREDVDQLMRRLERLPVPIKALHGGYDQAARFRVMSAFRTGEVKALVATDVASRGLDVKHVTHVINYDVPRDITDYTHRIGRTGRAGRQGKAVTFVSREDLRRWKPLIQAATWNIGEEPLPNPTRGRRDSPRREEPRREEAREPRREEQRREEARREEARREEPRREEPRREVSRREVARRHAPRREEPSREAPRREDTRRAAPPRSQARPQSTALPRAEDFVPVRPRRPQRESD